jgi:hydroxypyruvate reductase
MLTHSMRQEPYGPALERWMQAALQAVEPAAALRRALRRTGERTLDCAGRSWAIPAAGRVIVVGAGKAGEPMARAALEVAGDLVAAGLVVVKDGHRRSASLGPISLREAAHPTPDERGLGAARQIARLVDRASASDVVLVLLSGGASALLPAPVAGISLAELQTTTDIMLRSGAPIQAINALRKHCETLKGGQLARLAAPAQVIALVISDVVGSPLDVIASGPTVPDPSTYREIVRMLQEYRIAAHIPAAVLAHVQAGAAGQRPETPKASAAIWPSVSTTVVARNEDALAAAAQAARAEGWAVVELPPFEGEAVSVGRALGAYLRALAGSLQRPTVVIGGGETTVTLGAAAAQAQGGRNQELALAAAQVLAGLPNVGLLALPTDGGDGASPAAGAFATGDTLGRAASLGWDVAAALAEHNTYPLWHALEDALMLGPTRTNVNDLVLGVLGNM